MNITLTPQLKAMVDKRVASGRYQSASEVVREALRNLDEQDRLRKARIKKLRKEIELGLDDLRNGRVSLIDENTLDEIMAESDRMLAAYRASNPA